MNTKSNTKLLLFSCCLSLCVLSSEARTRYYGKDLAGAASESLYAYAPRPQEPMQLTSNYNLIMPDYYEHSPAESMQLQNFANFYDAQMSPDSDLGMEESQQFLHGATVRQPQQPSAAERLVRQQQPFVESKRNNKALLKLKKGNTQPRGSDYAEWDQFDYDAYSSDPSYKRSKYAYQ